MDRRRFRAGVSRVGLRGRGGWAAVLVGAIALASPALALSAGGKASRPVPITPAHGGAYRPVLGDWEGSANGFPVSFNLQWFTKTTKPHYTLNGLVALVPSTCPRVSYDYTESVIDAGNGGEAVGPRGGFDFGHVGFSGGLTGSRRATLTVAGSGGCGAVTWVLHPAHRIVVDDGTWKASFADGESSRFSVLGNGRLLSGLQVPRGLASCHGVSGAVDLFIGTAGGAYTSQPNVNVAMRFGHTSAHGTINADCRSGLSFTAKRVS